MQNLAVRTADPTPNQRLLCGGLDLLQFRFDLLPELSDPLRAIDHLGWIAFPKDFAVRPDEVGHGPVLEPVLPMVPAVLVPQHGMLEGELFRVLLDNLKRLRFTPRDFDDDQALL